MATERQLAARAQRRIREADAVEAATVDVLAVELEDLRAELRGAIAGQTVPVLALILADVGRRFTLREAAVYRLVAGGIGDSALQGIAAIDDVVDLAELPVRLPPLDTGPTLDRLRRYAREAVASSMAPARLGITSQLSALASGRQDLAATLAALGDEVPGSTVLGRSLERLTGVAQALMGEAAGAAQVDRALQLELALSPSPPRPDGRPDRAAGGPPIRKRWISSHKADARDSHALAQAKYAPGGPIGPIPYDEDFRVGRFSAPYPRGPGFPGAQKVHCGCRLAPVLG